MCVLCCETSYFLPQNALHVPADPLEELTELPYTAAEVREKDKEGRNGVEEKEVVGERRDKENRGEKTSAIVKYTRINDKYIINVYM